MLSSADLHLERSLLLATLTLFLGVGFLCTFIIFMIHSVQNKKKSTMYYLLLFVISGLIAVTLIVFYFYIILIE
ncbi:hypothetical protein DRF67_19965 [Chryseobacterium pennipullorum]|uniref:Uncharacterized protein n=1 Tax=Chryseobacterium pennipullorum TaxID=2258963 RepID=A0A3D9ANI3_9FLAO|nr:hypothetical protein DRF67_19965 [Chryseobacterium pennipullorum]